MTAVGLLSSYVILAHKEFLWPDYTRPVWLSYPYGHLVADSHYGEKLIRSYICKKQRGGHVTTSFMNIDNSRLVRLYFAGTGLKISRARYGRRHIPTTKTTPAGRGCLSRKLPLFR